MPEALNFDLSIVRTLTLFLTFSFDFGFSFFNVVMKVAPVLSVPRLSKFKDLPPSVNTSLSEVRTSVVPSDLIRAYLSSSNGRKVSLSPAVTDDDSVLLEILTVNSFLIEILADVRSRVAILFFGRGVKSVLSVEDSNLVVKVVKS